MTPINKPTPNTFILGAPKSGTTAMAQYLRDRPDVFFSDPKEPAYFASDYPVLARHHSLHTLDDYLALFAGADERHPIVAEGSTTYLHSRCAVANIVAFNPQARFIVMLRNPVEFAQAYHMEQSYVMNEDEPDFATAWRAQAARARGEQLPRRCRDPNKLQYGMIGRYGEQVQRLLATVPRESVLFIRYEDFRADAGACYRRLLAFLDLPDDGRSEFPVVNSSHRQRSQTVAKLVLTPPKAIEPIVLKLRAFLRRNRFPMIEALKAQFRTGHRRQTLAPELRQEMVAWFADDIRLLESLLGWDLSDWLDEAPVSPRQAVAA
ncbi:sulfotransferase family protein [Nevskia ramosa]|uniref:sulfotransferase family protein n=1 Tax=Nevskia ramosa TaxID=64002 RepID=UPI002356E6B9|nr:sulfotransferase [Nevskia ramosa]